MNLLFPNGQANARKISEDVYRHLAIEELIDWIGVTTENKNILREVMSSIPQDVETVRYRQEILKDFLNDEELCKELTRIIGLLEVLKEFNSHNLFTTQKRSSLWDMIDYMEEMDVYIQVIEGLMQLFAEHPVKSAGLRDIAALMQELAEEDRIKEVKDIVEALRADISTLRRVNVAVNLTPELRPEEVVVLGYDIKPFHSQFTKTSLGLSIAARRKITYREPSQFMKYIADDMENALAKTVQTNKRELKKYINLKGYFLIDICNDLKYYLLMAEFARKLQATNSRFCMPLIREEAEDVRMTGVYNIRLLRKNVDNIVKNDFSFDKDSKLFILTGPNRGGKTILTQAVGINALFASLGLFVTADQYEGYLFEDILTHFPADENQTIDFGRLGEEAVRVQKIVKQATPRTLVLLNETYSSTSAFDGFYLAKDLVHILKHKNVPMIFNTHIHDLACATEQMNSWDGPSRVVSLTMEIVNNTNTFRLLRKEPDRASYAHNIASKYGVTYEQMLQE